MKVTDEMVLAACNAYEPRAAAPSLDYWGEEHAADMRRAVEAALSRAAAPEPEWEYSTRAVNGFLYEVTTLDDARLAVEQSRRVHDYPGSTTTQLIRGVVRRRKAGQWEPVGGDDERQ